MNRGNEIVGLGMRVRQEFSPAERLRALEIRGAAVAELLSIYEDDGSYDLTCEMLHSLLEEILEESVVARMEVESLDLPSSELEGTSIFQSAYNRENPKSENPNILVRQKFHPMWADAPVVSQGVRP